MTPKFSAYLDSVRFLAALVVFLGHAAGKYWTGSFLWQLGPYGDTCVVVFFVLSGFVIGYVCDAKERTWQVFTSNRFARLWSVVLPALLLTFVIDFAGVRIGPALYLNQPWFASDNALLRYLASALMLQEVWHLKLVPGINAPFWSLTYEAIYYLVFGLALFMQARIKWVLILAALVLAGPLIAVLLPIWALGYFSYRFTRQHAMPYLASIGLFCVGAALLLASPSLRDWLPVKMLVLDEPTLGRYIDAIAFTMNLIGAHGLTRSPKPFPAWLQGSIATVASTTFVLYLFHRPLIQLFSYAGPADPASWSRRVLVIGGTLVIVAIATPLTERFRKYLRHKCTAAMYLWRPLVAAEPV